MNAGRLQVVLALMFFIVMLAMTASIAVEGLSGAGLVDRPATTGKALAAFLAVNALIVLPFAVAGLALRCLPWSWRFGASTVLSVVAALVFAIVTIRLLGPTIMDGRMNVVALPALAVLGWVVVWPIWRHGRANPEKRPADGA